MPTIINKHSETAGAVPATEALLVGEIAVNTADKKWFTKTIDDDVVCLNFLTVLDGGEIISVNIRTFRLQTESRDNLITHDGLYIDGNVATTPVTLRLQTQAGENLTAHDGKYIVSE